jgi:F420-non-reducing hydrogenase iron-sulfur subunit
LIRRTLQGLGVEPNRVKLVWASAAEGVKFTNEVKAFVEEIRALGPLNWGGVGGNGHEVEQQIPEEAVA